MFAVDTEMFSPIMALLTLVGKPDHCDDNPDQQRQATTSSKIFTTFVHPPESQ
jgi:hypothetical protein